MGRLMCLFSQWLSSTCCAIEWHQDTNYSIWIEKWSLQMRWLSLWAKWMRNASKHQDFPTIFFRHFFFIFLCMKKRMRKKLERWNAIDAKRKLFLWCLRFEQFTPFSCLFPASRSSARVCVESIVFACLLVLLSLGVKLLIKYSNVKLL